MKEKETLNQLLYKKVRFLLIYWLLLLVFRVQLNLLKAYKLKLVESKQIYFCKLTLKTSTQLVMLLLILTGTLESQLVLNTTTKLFIKAQWLVLTWWAKSSLLITFLSSGPDNSTTLWSLLESTKDGMTYTL